MITEVPCSDTYTGKDQSADPAPAVVLALWETHFRTGANDNRLPHTCISLLSPSFFAFPLVGW